MSASIPRQCGRQLSNIHLGSRYKTPLHAARGQTALEHSSGSRCKTTFHVARSPTCVFCEATPPAINIRNQAMRFHPRKHCKTLVRRFQTGGFLVRRHTRYQRYSIAKSFSMHGILQGILESEGVLQASYNVFLGGNAWPDSGSLLLAALLRKTHGRANGYPEMESCTLSQKNVRERFAHGQREVEPCTLSQNECSRVACRTGDENSHLVFLTK